MSAAEKLKALDGEKTFNPMHLWNALPQIVAVVEAAQSVTSADQGAWHGSRLLLSLAALDEALT